MQKVFGIGFHKTGTKSLAQALSILGYRVTGPDGVKDSDIAKNVHAMADELVKKYDAFQDNPWPILFKEMDGKCPGSKFILTIRRTDTWMKSVLGHFGSEDTPMRKWIYGVGHPEGNEEIYKTRYIQHNRAVIEYFANRPDDMIIMDFAAGDGWEKLCAFIGAKVPSKPFPHTNTAKERKTGFGKESANNSLRKRFFGS